MSAGCFASHPELLLEAYAATAVFGVLNNQALDNVYRGLRFIVNLAPYYLARTLWSKMHLQWVLTSVFGGGNDGGSTAARAIVRQDRLVASAASAAFRLASIS